MKCDPDIYRAEIACLNLSREQEDALLFTLWEVMRMMMELGWGVDDIHKLLPEFYENADQASAKLSH